MSINQKDLFFEISTPEENNMDSSLLQRMNDKMKEYAIRNIVISRNNKLIWECHEDGFDKVDHIFSCTKSILATLIGIAIDKGYIKSVASPIFQYFKTLQSPGIDERKRAITIRHLLNMTSGIDWPGFDKLWNKMKNSENWTEYVLARPMSHAPGEVFNYNSGGSQILSAILTKTTGQSALAFAIQHLFNPLKFNSAKWEDNKGINMGGSGLHISTRDMTKLGYLYLKKGKIGHITLVSEHWLNECISIQSSGYPNYLPQIFGYYGYHWWISPKEYNGICDYYYALGYSGQYIFVLPQLELVVSFRKALNGRNNSIIPKKILHDFIIKSIKTGF